MSWPASSRAPALGERLDPDRAEGEPAGYPGGALAVSLARPPPYPRRMGEVVNLNRWRKARARAEAEAHAAANRAAHGRTGAEKARDRQEAARRDAALDGARLESPPPARDGRDDA